jgi:uncharacterized ferritin-like protein (DUF455 family)
MKKSLFAALSAALATPEIEKKRLLTVAIATDWKAGEYLVDIPQQPQLYCGRPAQPELVAPGKVPQRNPQSPEGRARLLHAIAHIEFSAINLALDHAARFANMPHQYYADWIGVAAEEAGHFDILRQRLQSLGHDYGDFPAHAGLWEMAEKTAGDVLARMALVPRLLEARGLDATPPIQRKLEEAGDHESARLLDLILRDEVAHVGLGDAWFRRLCSERGQHPENTFRQLLIDFKAPWPSTPMNESARLAAGFTAEELASLRLGRPRK